MLNPEHPTLPALGKLLFEIWQGVALDWDQLLDKVKDCEKSENDKFGFGCYQLLAIKTCLGQQGQVLKDAGSIKHSETLRPHFVHRIIKTMQWLAEKSALSTLDQILARPALSTKIATTAIHDWNRPLSCNRTQARGSSQIPARDRTPHVSSFSISRHSADAASGPLSLRDGEDEERQPDPEK
jgi:hypothetical protein